MSIERILLIEDNPADAAMARELIYGGQFREAEITHAATYKEAVNYLVVQQLHPDIILTDLNLPDSRGIDTVCGIAALDTNAPIIVYAGLDDRKTALNSLRYGAQDYITKGSIKPPALDRTFSYAVERHQLKTTLRQYARQIEESEQRFRLIYETISDGMFIVDSMGKIVMSNAAARQFFSLEQREHLREMFFGIPASENRTTEVELLNGHGQIETYELVYDSFQWHNEVFFLYTLRDLTRRKQEERLRRQAEALKRVKQLSGALSHEFAQPLQILSGSLELIKNRCGESEEIDVSLRMIKRIAALVVQIRNINSLKTQDYLDAEILDLRACSDGD